MLQIRLALAASARSIGVLPVSRSLATSQRTPTELNAAPSTSSVAPAAASKEASPAAATDSPKASPPGGAGRTLGKSRSNHVARRDLRFIYPEFLPDPDPHFRNRLTEKLQRKDMLKRRENVELPEFYVGSVIAVTVADRNAQNPDKTSRFVGICIARGGAGLRAWAIVRNVIDSQGVEFLYDLYAPTVLKVETLKLEKRLDDELYYLRDAPQEFSTVPTDMEPEMLADGQPAALNEIVVPLNPPPWTRSWFRLSDRLMGYTFEYGAMNPTLQRKHDRWHMYRHRGWMQELMKYDLLLNYMETIPLEEQDEIWNEVGDDLIRRDNAMKKVAAQRSFTRPIERK